MKRRNLLKFELECTEPLKLETETCMNPWNGVCESSDIVIYIIREGRQLPICRECWRLITSDNIEWRYN